MRRRYGAALQPVLAASHQPQVLRTISLMEAGVARWNRLDTTLKSLATTAAAVALNCPWCLDFGYWENHRKGVDLRKLREVPNWRDSDVFTDLERKVMAYAEAMTQLPVEVTDEQVAELRARLGDAALVELTAMVAVENQRSRTNLALGLTSQGFKDRCDVPRAR
ncbi:Carboxymuconolactone decarboxylase family protein [Streptomyces sp. Go-475]|nr:carboxymuconolactone decarboxylase family protein [Streptomyces sp. Go-475]AXE88781.1 Carboxymuconolactone decarboxylase family protein [Streptomyces sp. Go-475]